MASTTSKTVPGFYRCVRCNTPNPSASYLTKCLGCGRPIPPFPTLEPASGPSETEVASQARPTGRGRKTLVSAAVYAGIVLASVGLIRQFSAGWWVVLALLFLPRWLFLLPIVPLAIAAARARRSVVFAVVLADALLVVGPLMGFQVPGIGWFSKAQAGPRVRVLTVNRGEAALDTALFLRYLDRHRIDVVCFQEQDRDSGFEKVLLEAGWSFNVTHRLASRFPIVKNLGFSTERESPVSMSLERVKIRHPEGFDFVVGSVHFAAVERAFGRLTAGDLAGFRINIARWDEDLVKLREWMADTGSTPLIVAGDFQMPADYHAMASLRASYPSAFEQAGWGTGPTWPTALPWARLDHIVATPDWTFTRAWVGPDLGSGHLPMIGEAVLIDRKPAD